MKLCPSCGHASADTAKFCAECATNLQGVTQRAVCWVIIIMLEDRRHRTCRLCGNKYLTLEALKDDNQLHLLSGLRIIQCYEDQLTGRESFTPLQMIGIANFGELHPMKEYKAIRIQHD